jgi:hypothetical protein
MTSREKSEMLEAIFFSSLPALGLGLGISNFFVRSYPFLFSRPMRNWFCHWQPFLSFFAFLCVKRSESKGLKA